jgi:phosphatidylglycerol lysyltransferase
MVPFMASSVSDVEMAVSELATPRAKPLSVLFLSLLCRLVLRRRRAGLWLAVFAALALIAPLLLDDGMLNLGWHLVLARHGIGATEGTLGLSLVFGVIASRGFIRRPGRRSMQAGDTENLDRALAILARQPEAAAGLVRLGDKQVLVSDCGDAFLMYARQGRSLIALFDPVGPKPLWAPLVAKFIAEARRCRCRPVFYQVSADFLPITVEMRLQALKLGEQAVVDLTGFSLAGGAWLKLRRSINRAERDGLAFELLAPEAVVSAMDELRAVSDTWLSAHEAAEKGFSLGTFDPDYLAAGPVAVIRLHGRIVAFASVMTEASGGDAFIDLMRHVPGVHRGMMDLLFVKIMETLKSQGFRSLNLGMAPLAGLAAHDRAPAWNHLARQVFEHGERFYNFRGVRAFKEKFDPDWRPRYLAVAGQGFPLASLIDVTLLIGGGLKGLWRK